MTIRYNPFLCCCCFLDATPESGFSLYVLIQQTKMAKVDIDTLTANFDTREEVMTGAVVVSSNRSHLFFVRSEPLLISNPGAYLNIVAEFGYPGPNVKSPLLAKFFFTGQEMAFLLPAPRIRDNNNQRVFIKLLPREFYRDRAMQREISVVVAYEDARDFNIGAVFP